MSSATIDIEKTLETHLATNFSNEKLRSLSQTFRREGLVRVSDLVPPEVKYAVRDEVLRLLDTNAERRDLRLATTGNTPRRMSVVRSENIANNSSLLRSIYAARSLVNALGELAREDLTPCPSKDEEFFIARHETTGDTHGWHWGDFPVALIWIVEAPPIESGGLLQAVPHLDWDKTNPSINRYLCENTIRTYHFNTGDIYFLRTDTTLHRTTPLETQAVRIILNMTWASARHATKLPEGNDRWFEDPHAKASRTEELEGAMTPHA